MGSICIYKGVVSLNDLHDLRKDTENALKEIGVDEDNPPRSAASFGRMSQVRT